MANKFNVTLALSVTVEVDTSDDTWIEFVGEPQGEESEDEIHPSEFTLDQVKEHIAEYAEDFLENYNVDRCDIECMDVKVEVAK